MVVSRPVLTLRVSTLKLVLSEPEHLIYRTSIETLASSLLLDQVVCSLLPLGKKTSVLLLEIVGVVFSLLT
jgi:hypothetical protein